MQRPSFTERLDTYLQRETSARKDYVQQTEEEGSVYNQSELLDQYILDQSQILKEEDLGDDFEVKTLGSMNSTETFQTRVFQMALQEKKKMIEGIIQKQCMRRKNQKKKKSRSNKKSRQPIIQIQEEEEDVYSDQASSSAEMPKTAIFNPQSFLNIQNLENLQKQSSKKKKKKKKKRKEKSQKKKRFKRKQQLVKQNPFLKIPRSAKKVTRTLKNSKTKMKIDLSKFLPKDSKYITQSQCQIGTGTPFNDPNNNNKQGLMDITNLNTVLPPYIPSKPSLPQIASSLQLNPHTTSNNLKENLQQNTKTNQQYEMMKSIYQMMQKLMNMQMTYTQNNRNNFQNGPMVNQSLQNSIYQFQEYINNQYQKPSKQYVEKCVQVETDLKDATMKHKLTIEKPVSLCIKPYIQVTSRETQTAIPCQIPVCAQPVYESQVVFDRYSIRNGSGKDFNTGRFYSDAKKKLPEINQRCSGYELDNPFSLPLQNIQQKQSQWRQCGEVKEDKWIKMNFCFKNEIDTLQQFLYL